MLGAAAASACPQSPSGPGRSCSAGAERSLGGSAVLGFLLQLVGGLFVLFANLVELPHVIEEVGASLESDEKLGLLAVASVV